MSPIRHDETLMRLIRDVNEIKSALRRTVANLPLFDIANENTPTTLSADQNDYVPGNYDILRLSSTANVSITGIANGKKGRRLQIFNVGTSSITLAHSSGSSLAVNRFDFVNDSDFIIPPSGNVLIYYDSTLEKWVGGDMASIYDVVNEVTPSQITANQNNYDIGLAEVLRLSTDADRTITGLSGGVKGRFLTIFNIGSFKITLPHQDTNSSAANRFDIVGDEDIVLFPTASVSLYYDTTTSRWLIPDRPAWLGTYGVSMRATAASQSIGTSGSVGDVKLTGFTETTDEWNLFDTTNSKFVIPETGLYMGVISLGFGANATGYRQIAWRSGGVNISVQAYPAITTGGVQTFFSCPIFRSFTAGDEIEIYATQNSGSSLNTNNTNLAFTRIL